MTSKPVMEQLACVMREMADLMLRDTANTCPQVVIGPIVWRPNDTGDRQWYFNIAFTSTEGTDGFRLDQILGDGKPLTEQARDALLFSLIQRRPIVIHDCDDDELEMARWCAAIWPGPRIAKIVAGLKAERTADA
jgi:hypothetical protein